MTDKLQGDCIDPSENGQDYWEGGNMDDTFQQGERSGYCDALYDIGHILGMDLPDKKEIEF